MALLHVDKPCVTRQDEFEPNDSEASAKPIDLRAPPKPAPAGPGAQPSPPQGPQDVYHWRQSLMSCPDDVDVFSIAVKPGDRLTATLKATSDLGRLTLSLKKQDGTVLVPPGKEAITTFNFVADKEENLLLRIDNMDGEELTYDDGIELMNYDNLYPMLKNIFN